MTETKQYTFKFSGCSCGCTSSERYEISSSDQQETVKALGLLFNEYRVSSHEPFKKCSIECEEDLKEKVVEFASTLNFYEKSIESVRKNIKEIEYNIESQNRSANVLGIELPDHIKRKQEDSYESIRLLKDKLSFTVLEGNNFSKIDNEKVKVESHWYDSDDNTRVSEYFFPVLFSIKEKEYF